MHNVLKRRYKNIYKDRKEFRNELEKEMKSNKTLAVLIIETYKSYKHNEHIIKIWRLLKKHKDAKKDYFENLMEKHLATSSSIWESLRDTQYISFDKYKFKIPEEIAMGDALGVAYKVLEIK